MALNFYLKTFLTERRLADWKKREQSRKNFECLLPLLFQSHLARWPEKRTILETQEDGACLPRAAEHKFLPFFNTRGKTNCSLDAPLQLQLPIRIHFEMTSSAWLSCVSITISKTLKRDSFPYFLFHHQVWTAQFWREKKKELGQQKNILQSLSLRWARNFLTLHWNGNEDLNKSFLCKSFSLLSKRKVGRGKPLLLLRPRLPLRAALLRENSTRQLKF